MAYLLDRITTNPDQCGGRPCVRGLRIRVADVLDLLAAGESAEEILAEYPYLEAADIGACLQYAARRLDHPILNHANEQGAQVLTRRGEEVAVVPSFDDYRELKKKRIPHSEFFRDSPLTELDLSRDRSGVRSGPDL